MGMVFCRGCGQQIHGSAISCPHCGAPQGVAPVNTLQKTGKADETTIAIPDGIRGWSWGAFLLNWIWAIGNKTWIGLLVLIPYVGVIFAIILGIKGREWAWKNKQWASVEEFNRVQRKWSIWGLSLTGASILIGVAAAIAIPAYGSYMSRVAEQNNSEARAEQNRVAELDRQMEIQEAEKLEAERQIEMEQQAQLEKQQELEQQIEEEEIASESSLPANQAQETVTPQPSGVSAPKMLVGEKYVLQSIDHQNPKLNNSTERAVISIEDGNTVYKVTNVKSGYVRYLTFNRDLALVATKTETGGTTEYDPPIAYYKFPLKVGADWSMKSSEKSNGALLKTHNVYGKVEGMETITTNLGTYSAYKVILQTNVVSPDGSVSSGADTSWYVPELKRAIKSELYSKNQDGSSFLSKTVTLESYNKL